MITGIDHIAIEVKDFEATVRNYEVVFGRSPNWRGGATGWKHAWFQFENAALDVVAADGDSDAANAIRAEIDKFGEGIMGVGFSVPDRDDAAKLLERRGLSFVPPHTTISQDATGRQRQWSIRMMKRASGNGVALFIVENKPDAARWPAMEAQFGDASVSGLDHVVVQTPNVERALVLYGARLGLDLRLDRANEQWGARQLFFRCGNAVVEIGASLKAPVSDAKDKFGGLAWRVKDPEAARARIAAAGIDVSEVRKGRKPGTAVFTVRNGTGVPTLMLSGND
ncbi:MAG: VOC family protein [Alphaproteobacteria bacterium]|nr:VOC family protein [Alphaproteobacteria bacterium]MBV9418590.1 VOC family protein [Alphaproteobacteria bacterium]MBV9542528.1 VOC family protein [Alphaproteobacteria bacterium]MBV9903534.1 VOC family protein [Alphaproteobacteria bacterium]